MLQELQNHTVVLVAQFSRSLETLTTVKRQKTTFLCSTAHLCIHPTTKEGK